MEIEIKSLSAKTLDDFLFFFDDVAFTDNPEWASCYCLFFHFPGSLEEWMSRKKEDNRNDAVNFIREGRMQGYLAYFDDSPIGWCNVNSKNHFAALARDEELKTTDDDSIASIVCFLVAPGFRNKSVAGRLLKRVCEDYKDKGYQYLEAYPRTRAKSAAENYHGPLSLYIKHGFEVFKEYKNYRIVRKKL